VSIQTTLSSVTITVGGSVTDSATLAGQSATASGMVTYTDFNNGVCAAPVTTVSVVTVTNGVVPNSRAVIFNSTGSFSFQAVYGGDANDNSAISPCESLTVQKATPSITTGLSSTTITVGQSATDSATLSNSYKAVGSVAYSVFNNGACTPPATVASVVAVTNGAVPNSRAVMFNATGSYSFEAVYSGDSNNNPSTSACEPLTVVTVVPPPLHSTQTVVTCSPGSVLVNTSTSCTARVIDNSTSPTVPTGTVAFVSNSTGTFNPLSATCTLVAGSAPNMATCFVSYTPNVIGKHLITGSYGGDSSHAKSNGTFTLNVRSRPSGSVLLTFNGFELDDFNSGVGQLDVLVNGQLVADVPAGLNHLTGTGDYKPYENVAANFGPFDITNLLTSGQNTILFKDPTSFDHFGIVRNVTVVQDGTILLQVLGARGVYPGFSFIYTFSMAPLVIASFTASATSLVQHQSVTFTATYTGGTAPYRSAFNFGDGESMTVAGGNGACSATHDYDSASTFRATVIVKGASTSDRVSAHIRITISDPSPSPTISLMQILNVTDDS
jgi:hypothetical protein